MNKIIPNFIKVVFTTSLLLFISFLYPASLVFAQENFLEMSVSQEIRVNSPYAKPREAVSYRLEALEQAPLPDGASGTYDFNIIGDSSYKLRFQDLAKGIYHYKLYQLPPVAFSRLIRDTRSYSIQLEVFQSPDGIVIRPSVEDDNHHKPESLSFVNKMNPEVGGDVTNPLGENRISSRPNTGDNYDFSGLMFALSTGTLILFILIMRKRKEKNSENYKSKLDDSSN